MGIAKLYSQSGGNGGFKPNGIIEDYYVYAGERIEKGDFVELLTGSNGAETETQVRKATTSDIYGVAKTSGEGGMAELSDNLVVNGDFSNGFANWADLSEGRVSYETTVIDGSNCLKMTIVGSLDFNLDESCRQVVEISSDKKEHIYYASVEVKGNSSNTSVSNRGISLYTTSFTTNTTSTSVLSAKIDVWQKLSLHGQLGSKPNDAAGDYVGIWLNGANGANDSALGNEYYFKDVKLYDLTEIFGTGNEPTKEWCDENFPLELGHKDKVSVYRINYKILKNGEFHSLDGWYRMAGTAYIAFSNFENSCLLVEVIKGNTSDGRMQGVNQNVSIYTDHVYYAKTYYKEESSNTSHSISMGLSSGGYVLYKQVNNATPVTEWTKISDYGTSSKTNNSATFGLSISIDTSNVGNKVYFDNTELYDLTAMFGKGNEPTQEWCDANL